ncbi:glycosyltransferase [Actinokineospora sp. UTMC 2448]|uniref:glycosyltransferase n=1 Tax=Actinokineospora sp. UTMC 2448 TaxID=2268449 RepID=UPI00216434DD|nr:nucleotide disphospho-sugar-binding domain-containing protein [Actinokineospora sp. UTMC 2448]UVS78685.1 Glycosyltransferase PerS4 [Actinokineospora sp. UTMC 2448]
MRLLFVTSPLVGHVFPLVSTAWAAAAAGHDVVVATAGDAVGAARGAGLAVVDLTGGQNPMARFRAQAPAPPPVTGEGTAEAMVAHLFGTCSVDMAAAAVALAADWRPDCIVHSALDGAGPMAARAHKIPLLRHTFAMGETAPAMIDGVWRMLEPLRREHGVDDDPVEPLAVVDPGPRSLRESTPDRVAACRFVPFNGGGELPDWLYRGSGPRLCVTLGTVVPWTSGADTFRTLLDAAAGLDAEVVVANGHADLSALGALPPNVRVAGYVPLSALLPTCAAVVHHGGPGSAANALAVGIPQLALPHMADQFDISAALDRRGIGLVQHPQQATVDSLRRDMALLLDDPGLRERAGEVAEENAALPPVADMVAGLVGRVAAR